MSNRKPATIAELRASGHVRESVKEELRRNLHLAHYRDEFDVASSVIEALRPGRVYVA